MRSSQILKLLPVFVFIGIILTLIFTFGGYIPGLVFTVATVGGFAFYLMTTFRHPLDPKKIIVPYLLTMIFFIGHVYEEYLTHFDDAIGNLTGKEIPEIYFLSMAAFFAPMMWLVGAVLILKQIGFGYYLLSFFLVAMTIAELSHFVFPFIQSGTFHYFSGMITAALPLFPAAYCVWVILKDKS